MTLDLPLINEAAAFLAGRIRRTPVEESPLLSELLGVPVFLKLEFLQLTGSFKLRGALFRLGKLSAQTRPRAVVTCSAGNHGWAVAYAARAFEIAATVFVPATVDESKLRGITSLGAQVIRSEFPGYDDTEALALEEAKLQGLPFISAYDDFAIMAGNGGSLAKEILEDLPFIRTFVFPVGGGGLAAGLAYFVKSQHPDSHLIACQHVESSALSLSLEQGRAVRCLPSVETLAGGIEGGIGHHTFDLLRERLDRVLLLSEEEIWMAVRWVLKVHHYLIEPSAAVAVAACLSGELGRLDTPVVLVLTGRNLALSALRRILCG